jgi:Zn-dependent M16 (insulinase) family peptidase
MAFTVLGTRTVSYTNPAAPLLLLITELLQNCYLHQEIREKGGAYGSGSSYAPSTGNFYLSSYRDPQLSQTLKAFEAALQMIASNDFTDEDLEEAKLCILQTIDAPVIPQNRAVTSYAWLRAGRTKHDRIAFRTAIVNASKEAIVDAIKTHLLPLPKITVSFLGKELFEKERKSKVFLEDFGALQS